MADKRRTSTAKRTTRSTSSSTRRSKTVATRTKKRSAEIKGIVLIALGIFISSLTESQIISVVISFAASLVLAMMDNVATMINVPVVTKVIEKISFVGRYNTFCYGIIDYSNIVFFIVFAAIFIFLTVRVLDKRRYS